MAHQRPLAEMTYINCSLCPAQAYISETQKSSDFTLYVCPAGHRTFVEADASFNYGWNKESDESLH